MQDVRAGADARGPVLETERLILRPTKAEDFEPWAAFAADERATRYLGGVQPRAAAWRGFLQVAGAWTIQGFSMFSALEKETGLWIGRLGPWRPEGWPGPEIGWGLAPRVWGKGLATEGAQAATRWAFEDLGWTEVIHCIDPGNAPSIAVARRLGSNFRRRDRLPAPYHDIEVDIWGQSRDEWRQRLESP
jgi:RimJ/RimL family protein N-acetyltransferase